MRILAYVSLSARIALPLALGIISWLALSPASPPMPGHTDKLAHIAAFITLALLADVAFPQRDFDRTIILPLLAYGAGLEIIQAMLPYRFGSLADFLADATGVMFYGWILHPLICRFSPHRHKFNTSNNTSPKKYGAADPPKSRP